MIDLKSDIHLLVDTIQDEQFLGAVFTLLEKQVSAEHDFWTTLSEDQRDRIRQGMADVDAGQYKPLSTVLAKYSR